MDTARGTKGGALKLFDVTSWEMFYSSEYYITPKSVYLTQDSKYLVVGGNSRTWGSGKDLKVGKSEKCVVLKIQ